MGPLLLYELFFSTSGHSNETIASCSTDVSCMVALQTALIDTAVDLCGGMRVTSAPNINILRINSETHQQVFGGM